MKIISDGTGVGTVVMGDDGKKLDNVTKIEINPIENHTLVTAKLTFQDVELQIIATEDKEDIDG